MTVLRGRQAEQQALDNLLMRVRGGDGGALALRGEPGSGKTALLGYLADRATGIRVVRTCGTESESEIAHSGLQRLCAPLLGFKDQLPIPQRTALNTAFGLAEGPPPELLVLSIATLGLCAAAAVAQPLICVVDDVQWLDRVSARVLAFAARRLGAGPVGLVLAGSSIAGLDGLPELTVGGLGDEHARALLDSVLAGPVDPRVRERIVAEARGNPRALLESSHGLSPAELAFGPGGCDPAQASGELPFGRRIAELSADARTVLVTAAIEPVGDPLLLWRALRELGVAPEAAARAEAAGLIEIGMRVRFADPCARLAAWRSGSAVELREAHRALAAATDPDHDPDRRAWHLAHSSTGTSEEIAAELVRAAERVPGRAVAGAFLERAAELTAEPATRGTLLVRAAAAGADAGTYALVPNLLGAAEMAPLTDVERAHTASLRARVTAAAGDDSAAVPALLAAAERLRDADPAGAREAWLTALGAALRCSGAFSPSSDEARQTAAAIRAAMTHRADAVQSSVIQAGAVRNGTRRAAAVRGGFETTWTSACPGRPVRTDSGKTAVFRTGCSGTNVADLLLDGLVRWILDGRAAGMPVLCQALETMNDHEDLRLIGLAGPVAHELHRMDLADRISEQAVRYAHETGTLSLLPAALALRAESRMHAGHLAAAENLLAAAGPAGAATRMTVAAYRGHRQAAVDLIDATAQAEDPLPDAGAHADDRLRNRPGRTDDQLRKTTDRLHDAAQHARAILFNSLGEHRLVLESACLDHGPLLEIVEAAAHSGDPRLAAEARDRLAERTATTGTGSARGLQALADALADADEDHYREAVERLSTPETAILGARAHLLFGEWLRRAGRRNEARDHLRTAHEAFTAMGASALAARAGREMAAAGGPSRGNSGTFDLTAQESAVARLAATGHTNPEIGAALFLSPRTVEWHLRKTYTKLGITSRRQLAATLQAA